MASYLCPKRWPSPLMDWSTEVIAGVPQIVHKIPLDATVSEHLTDLDSSKMFDRLIVGPSAFPWPIYEAFVVALAKAGVTDANELVFTSDISIRN